MASNAHCLAFRRLVYNFSRRLNKEECQAIVYIRLCECLERYRDVSTLDVLSKLEMCGVFSPGNPTGLLDIAKDIQRSDLVNLVKDYIKSQKSKETKAKTKNASSVETKYSYAESSGEETAQLRATLEVTLSQVSELVQQVDILQRAIASKERQKAAEANKEAGRTVQELAEHFRKVQKELERGSSRPSSSSSEEGEYYGSIILNNMATSCLCMQLISCADNIAMLLIPQVCERSCHLVSVTTQLFAFIVCPLWTFNQILTQTSNA